MLEAYVVKLRLLKHMLLRVLLSSLHYLKIGSSWAGPAVALAESVVVMDFGSGVWSVGWT